MSFTKPGKPVIEIIKETMPNTVILALASIVIAILIGLSLGIVSALCYGSWIDKIIQLISTFGMSLPSFLVRFYLLGSLDSCCMNSQV